MMMKLRRILNYPARLRRSLGFGVHSPFAYNFITNVLRLKGYEYYAYYEIAGFCPRTRKVSFNEIFAGRDMTLPEAKLVFRILCYFRPGVVVNMGNGHEVNNVLFRRAIPGSTVVRWGVERRIELPPRDGKLFVLVNQIPEAEVDDAICFLKERLSESECVVVVRNISRYPVQARVWNAVKSAGVNGMGFTDGHTGIFVAEKGLPYTIYDILL